MRCLVSFLFSAIYLFHADAATAATCLDDVAAFAQRICGEIASSGNDVSVDANGNVNAGVSNIIKRAVGGASAEMNGHVIYNTYTGVARDQLAGVQFNVIDCKQKMVAVALVQLCPDHPGGEHPPVRPRIDGGQFQNKGLKAALTSVTPLGNTVTASVHLENISDSVQLVHYCALTAEVNAHLKDGRTLTLDSSRVGGIDNSYASELRYCISSAHLENMTQLMPGASSDITLTWYSHQDKPIPPDQSISFPFNVIASTVPSKYKDSEALSAYAGPIHSAVINFPFVPFSTER